MGYIGIFVYYVLLIIYNKLCIGCGAYIYIYIYFVFQKVYKIKKNTRGGILYALFFRKCIEKIIKPV